MKNLLTPGRNLAVPLLLGFWGCVCAQSLGTPSAEVLLGRPLEMSVPARFDSADKGDECVHADVFYGETRVRADQVRAVVTGPQQQRRIRVEAAAPVDEPVVTVSVRAGCRNTVTRNYTLLPEYPSEPLLAAIEARTRTAAAVPSVPGMAPAPVAQAPAARTSPRIAGPRPLREVVAEAAAAVKAPAAAAKAPVRALRQDAPARGARLKLEPLEALEPQARTLLRSTGLLAEPEGDESRRATAALLWKALNADPQELLRTSAMLQKLESDLLQLRKATGQTQAEMAALRKRLDQAQPWYVSAGLVTLLSLLVLAAGAGAGALWWRTRRFDARTQPWYLGRAPSQPAAAEAAVAEPVPATAPAWAAEAEAGAATPQAVPSAPGTPAPPAAVPLAAASSRLLDPIDFQVPEDGAGRQPAEGLLRVETLAATFEEVEFLSSLGLAGDAVDVLKSYLQDSSSPAPLAFFELMRLCDQDGDAAALGKVRRRYAQAFGVEAPPLQELTVPLGLESLPALSAAITRAWGTPQAQQMIERTLFSVPAPGLSLTLQAGRDLICLYDLAMALESETADAAGGSEADAHPLAPWAHAEDPAAAQAAAQAVAEAQGGHRFALDVDLTVAPQPLPEKQEEPGELQLAPLLAELKAAAARDDKARAQAEAEDAFSAVMASERVPVSRF